MRGSDGWFVCANRPATAVTRSSGRGRRLRTDFMKRDSMPHHSAALVGYTVPSVLLDLNGIRKQFGGVTALRDGNLCVGPGEVHLLLGENGAGKSTLMKIVAGMERRDAGRMLWQGHAAAFRTPAEAAAAGIAMVHQESLLAPHLTVAENLFLGREERLPFGWVNRRRMIEQASRMIEEHHFPLDADWRVERLSPAGKQLVGICRAIQHGSSLLIFDEPTSSLSGAETEEVFRIVRTLRARGMGVIYITHRLEELRAIGDRVTILRDGATVHDGPLAEVSTDRIIQHMVGHPAANAAAIGSATHRDFRLFAACVADLNDGGVYLNVGSAVVMPEVFLKAVSAVRNLGHPLAGFTTANFDFLQHYRPRMNVVQRPHAGSGGAGYAITGHHELMIPLLAAALIEKDS